jgi:vacuolar-type H+-ATPase subunit B/Vma2
MTGLRLYVIFSASEKEEANEVKQSLKRTKIKSYEEDFVILFAGLSVLQEGVRLY